MINKNRIFILFLVSFSCLTFFLAFSFVAKFEASTQEENFNNYKKLSNNVVLVEVMEKALKEDVLANVEEEEVSFVTVISLLAAKYYGDWNEYDEKDLDEIVKRLKNGEKEKDLSQMYPDYDHFKVFYETLFKEFVGRYIISKEISSLDDDIIFERKYGLKAYSPIAYGYKCSFCDDFDNEVNFAKQKGHFGNDIAAKKGTPFVAVESGVITKCDKDFGGTIELTSFDGKRTYIYRNCNEKKPFAKGIKKGVTVFGGQILGFVGANNCCKKGGASILNCPYLHFALKLKIENKNSGKKEVYVDVYNILKFLEHHKAAVIKLKNGFLQENIFRDEVFEKNRQEETKIQIV